MINFCTTESNQTASNQALNAASTRWRTSLTGWPTRVLLAASLGLAAQAARGTGLTWQGSSDPSVVGYNIYYGGTSGNYTNVVSLGKVTTASISGLIPGATYYFAATAINSTGAESSFSTEINYTVTVATGTKLQVSMLTGGQFQLAGTGIANHAYEILASTNLLSWSSIGTQTADASGAFQFTDANAKSFTTRYYRTVDTQQ